ncbi:MAG TPA: DUF4157 domain-containing protein, partial [Caldilineaceae bacterium]|nr:DUF4157 domain-containing protein [Caldilineaceae bacterium]
NCQAARTVKFVLPFETEEQPKMPENQHRPERKIGRPATGSAAPAPRRSPSRADVVDVVQRVQTASPSLAPPDIHVLQRAIGNRATERLLSPVLETENDQTPGPGDIAEDELAQASPLHGREGGEVDSGVENAIQRAQGGGRPLDTRVQRYMEDAIGAGFSDVRVHTDAQADALNRSLNANAFTTGKDIFFGQGQYQPGSSSGQELIAHELTHTVQQGAVVLQRASAKSRISSDESAKQRDQATPIIQRIVDDEIAEIQASNSKSQHRKNVLELLQKYNEHMRSGEAPTEEQWNQLTDAINELHNWKGSYKRKPISGELYNLIDRVQERLNLEIHALDEYRDITPDLEFTRLGSGAVNTVYRVLFGDNWEAVWKEDETETEVFQALDSGISGGDANLGSRNIAMYKLDQLLGTGVIPLTERAMHDGKAGTVMELVKGRELRKDDMSTDTVKAADIDYSHPEVQRGLSNLQVLDMIANQVDRHSGNVMATYDERGNVTGIRGIDNDFAFGQLKQDPQGRLIGYNRGLPDYIDRRLAETILTIEPDDVRSTLRGLIVDEEIEMTVERFIMAKEHIEELTLIDEWTKETFQQQRDIGLTRSFESETTDENREERIRGIRDTQYRAKNTNSYLVEKMAAFENVIDMISRNVEGVFLTQLGE